MRRFEAIGQREHSAAMLERLRKQVEGDFICAAAHELFAGEFEQARRFLLRILAPLLKAGHVNNIGRDCRVVEREHVVVVNQYILSPRLVFNVLDLADQLSVVTQELSMRIDFAGDQALTDKYLARFDRIDGTVMHAPTWVDDEAVQRHLLECHHLAALPLPVRLEMGARHQMSGKLLDPFRFDRRHRARIHARGFGELRRHHPFHPRGFLLRVLLRTTRQLEFNAAGAEIVIALDALGADIADQAGEQRAMNVIKLGRLAIQMHTLRRDQLAELRMHIAPLAHAQGREKIFMQKLVKAAIRFLVLPRVFVELPHFHEGEKLGLGMGEFLVREG